MSSMNTDINFVGYDDDRLNPLKAPPLAGNYADDDGMAIDDYFEAANQGPIISEGYDTEPEKVIPVTRILSVSFSNMALDLVNPNRSFMLFPADRNRKMINVKIVGGTGTAFYFSSEPFSFIAPAVPGDALAGIGLWQDSTNGSLTILGHTGPLHVCPAQVAPITLNGWALTE